LIGQALNRTNFFGAIKKRKLVEAGYFTREDNEKTLHTAFEVLSISLSSHLKQKRNGIKVVTKTADL